MINPIWISIVGIVIEILILLVGGVIVVMNVKGTTLVLNENTVHLKESIDKLDKTISIMQQALLKHENRITRLEEKLIKR